MFEETKIPIRPAQRDFPIGYLTRMLCHVTKRGINTLCSAIMFTARSRSFAYLPEVELSSTQPSLNILNFIFSANERANFSDLKLVSLRNFKNFPKHVLAATENCSEIFLRPLQNFSEPQFNNVSKLF